MLFGTPLCPGPRRKREAPLPALHTPPIEHARRAGEHADPACPPDSGRPADSEGRAERQGKEVA